MSCKIYCNYHKFLFDKKVKHFLSYYQNIKLDTSFQTNCHLKEADTVT